MEWSDLQVFLAAVRTGSYTAAGRLLAMNRTTVGRRIDALEASLGVPLFADTPRGPAPTKAGERLLKAATDIEREVAGMLDDLALGAQAAGSVRIAASAGIVSEFLPQLLRFQQANPQCAIELLGELDALDAVTCRRADLAIALVRSPPLRLAGEQVAVLSQARYVRHDLPDDAPHLGWGHELDAALPGGHWAAANPSGEAAERAGLITCNSWPQMKQAVLAGFGSAVLWCFAGDAEPGLRRITPPDPRHDCPLWLLHRAKAPPGPGLTKLIAFLQQALATRLAPDKDFA
ncbi:LysR family transcriptional regulator [Novosphingobium sp.]|uniref:LysR family transcriptional regulator n=1 Tax=Novosphingobium sp. TaxID=1874826 RepID=UPI0038B84A72